MKCQKCGFETDTTYCGNCGAPMPVKSQKIKKQFYSAWWFWVIVALLIFGIIFCLGKVSDRETMPASAFSAATSTPEPTAEPTPEVPKSVLDIADKLGVGYLSFTFDEDDNEYWCGYTDRIISFEMDGEVVISVYSKSDIFYSDGAVVQKVTDIIPSYEEMITAQAKATEFILSVLKAPSTAKFPDSSGFYGANYDWDYSKNKNIFSVSAFVDAENSFGAMLRKHFTVKFDISNGSWRVDEYEFFD